MLWLNEISLLSQVCSSSELLFVWIQQIETVDFTLKEGKQLSLVWKAQPGNHLHQLTNQVIKLWVQDILNTFLHTFLLKVKITKAFSCILNAYQNKSTFHRQTRGEPNAAVCHCLHRRARGTLSPHSHSKHRRQNTPSAQHYFCSATIFYSQNSKSCIS